MIREYGIPAFCKIDIENYEYEALTGLSQPLRCLSFEYYPPFMANGLKCIDRLEELGTYSYNWSFGESQQLESEEWIAAADMKNILSTYTEKKHYGDVYAKLRE